MNFRKGQRRAAPEINLIAFIDVLLVILIFLMVSTTFSKYTSLQVSLDLVGQRLAARPGLGDLQQQAGREDALPLKAIELELGDALELVDGRHGRSGPRWKLEIALAGGKAVAKIGELLPIESQVLGEISERF